MDGPKPALYCGSLLAMTLLLAACSYPQQTRFQTAFLPAPPKSADLTAEIAPPPAVETNVYLHDAAPAFLSNPRLLVRPPESVALLQRADHAFQRGKHSYQAHDLENARKQFDMAVDLILEAAEHSPAEKQEYARRLDEMVDAIHRFDLAGFGASATVEEGKFEKAPLEDLLQMTFPVDP